MLLSVEAFAAVGAPAGDHDNARTLNAYGLKMRMLSQDGFITISGAKSQGFGEVYLGDKRSRGGGANTRYKEAANHF